MKVKATTKFFITALAGGSLATVVAISKPYPSGETIIHRRAKLLITGASWNRQRLLENKDSYPFG
jgi:hypothetical protein